MGNARDGQAVCCTRCVRQEAGIPNKRIGVLRNMKVEAARKAWEAHGRRDMSVRDNMNLIMSV